MIHHPTPNLALDSAHVMALRSLRRSEARARTIMRAIAVQIEVESGFTIADLKGHSRCPEVARARHIFMHAASERGISARAIGRELCRDHSTVFRGVQAEEERRAK